MSLDKLNELDSRLMWLLDRAIQQTEQKEELTSTDSRMLVDLSKVMGDLHKRMAGIKVISKEAAESIENLESMFGED